MPLAVVFSHGNAVPAVISEPTDDAMLRALEALQDAPTLPDTHAARMWLLSQPVPSGLYDNPTEAKASIAQFLALDPEMSGDEMQSIRKGLGLSRAAFATLLGFGGNDNTRHKHVFDMENGKKTIMPEKARRARAIAAADQLAAE